MSNWFRTGSGTPERIKHADIPDYVKKAVIDVADKVKAVQTSESITFIAMSDAHQLDANANIVAGNLHAGMAAKALAYVIPNMDFCCYLGDYTAGTSMTTIAEGKRHIAEINVDIDEAFKGIPQFRTVGNHDSCAYSQSQNGATIPDSELFGLIGSYCQGAVYGSQTGGYCYRDFETKKLRVICLNTSESITSANASAGNVSDEQKLWFANTLKAVGAKSGWNILILSHHPLDWGGVCILSNIVKAYVDGSSITVSSGNTISFSGSNNATILAAIHGHVHCFKAAKLNSIASGVGTEYDIWRIATPNMCFARNNEYGQNGSAEYYGIEFGEDTTCPKTADSAQDTAFVVNVINPSTQKIYSFCYGAGYDRETFIGEETIPVTGIELSASTGELVIGASVMLTATVSPANASNKAVIWSSSAPTVAKVENGTVTALTTGTAVITAKTADGGFTATYSVTVKTESVDLLATHGYADNTRLSTGNGAEKTAAGYVTIGHSSKIPVYKSLYPNGVKIRISGADQVTGGSTASPYADCAIVAYINDTFNSSTYIVAGRNLINSTVEIDSDAKGCTYTWDASAIPEVHYCVAFCVKGTGANLTATITAL